MYQVIGTRASRTFRVLWMLEEMGVEYAHIPANPRSDEVRALNPSGKVPVLRDGDAVLTESVAIMAYLGDKHGQFCCPAGTVARARQDALSFQILDEIDAVLWATARHSFILPEEHRVPAIKEPMKWEYARNLKRLSDKLEGPFLMGEALSIPDILLTHCLRWAEIAKFPAPDDKLSEYKARMEARAAFQKVLALP